MSLFRRVAIVGVGLIGGSIGLALTRRGLAETVVGIGRRKESLAAAQKAGAIHESSLDLAAGVAGADLVLVCTPVGQIAADAIAAAAALSDAIISDAGSTKAAIVEAVERKLCPAGKWQRNVRFLGGHPIAGSEKKGIAHAREDLFEGRTCVLTPTGNTTQADKDQLSQLWGELGASVVTMSPDEHDRVLAAISHAPHVVAAALAAATPAKNAALAAGGWLDTTRIAAGDVSLWQQILLANSAHVLEALVRIEKQLSAMRTAIGQGNAGELENLLAKAKRVRDAVGS